MRILPEDGLIVPWYHFHSPLLSQKPLRISRQPALLTPSAQFRHESQQPPRFPCIRHYGFNIPRYNRRPCQDLSVSADPRSPVWSKNAEDSSLLPLQSHVPSVFPYSLSAKYPPCTAKSQTIRVSGNLSVKFQPMYSLFLRVLPFKISTENGESQVLK